ncbi:acyltransferase [Sphingomonas ginsenosidivorax]|uniref:Acyltransferase n=1 Tax=Sphingomonas ginsenosidivorax TaxID=862135 RepID=A0A5C6UD75_9SPHN|nr:acyltransferase [Sphingomonas ginsenosidivorax]TXC69975.1 acyltransferase [Sphingomonas ginsenosidivorax]
MTELRPLTSIRGLAAWFVVLYHIRLSIAGLSDWARAIFAKGYLAVDFFFLLSGFVIWLTWHERLGGRGSTTVFLRKRIARIWPLHIVMLAAAVAVALLIKATGRAVPSDYPFAELPLHVVLVQNWGFTDRLAWNDPSWSISTELGAYLLFPLLVRSVDWRRLPTLALLTIAAAILLLLHLAMAAPTLGTDIPRWGLLRCLTEFTTGTIVCALWLRWRGRRSTLPVAAAGVALLLTWAGGTPETLVIPAAFACLLLVLALTAASPAPFVLSEVEAQRTISTSPIGTGALRLRSGRTGVGRHGNPLEGRALHYLGEISYATYLSHFVLWTMFKLAFVNDANAVPPLLIALYLALVMASSVALYHLVERPAQRWINGRATGRSPAKAGARLGGPM